MVQILAVVVISKVAVSGTPRALIRQPPGERRLVYRATSTSTSCPLPTRPVQSRQVTHENCVPGRMIHAFTQPVFSSGIVRSRNPTPRPINTHTLHHAHQLYQRGPPKVRVHTRVLQTHCPTPRTVEGYTAPAPSTKRISCPPMRSRHPGASLGLMSANACAAVLPQTRLASPTSRPVCSAAVREAVHPETVQVGFSTRTDRGYTVQR